MSVLRKHGKFNDFFVEYHINGGLDLSYIVISVKLD